jgi:hypothetical protein
VGARTEKRRGLVKSSHKAWLDKRSSETDVAQGVVAIQTRVCGKSQLSPVSSNHLPQLERFNSMEGQVTLESDQVEFIRICLPGADVVAERIEPWVTQTTGAFGTGCRRCRWCRSWARLRTDAVCCSDRTRSDIFPALFAEQRGRMVGSEHGFISGYNQTPMPRASRPIPTKL